MDGCRSQGKRQARVTDGRFENVRRLRRNPRRLSVLSQLMKLHRSLFARLFGVGSLAVCLSTNVTAQTYPSRPITMIVPFAPGGGTDALARIMAESMRKSLGQPIIIENVPGATGSIGVGRAVRAAGDGYTLSIGTSYGSA
jgi:hypothetical protein